MLDELHSWTPRHWKVAAVAALLTLLLIGIPTDVIPNPIFGRAVGVTWWSYPVLVVTAVLGGLLLATYVRVDDPALIAADRPARSGGVAGLLSYFAVGCPVCNKLVVVAIGTVGARRWLEPIQPFLAAVSIVLLALALRSRLRNARSCALPAQPPAAVSAVPPQ